MDIDARAFGQLEGEVKALAQTLEAQNKTLAAQNDTLAQVTKELGEIKTTLAEARGGWKTLIWIAGAAAAAASGVTWVMQHLRFGP
jgi:phage shock protein A